MDMNTVALLSPLVEKLIFRQKVIDGKVKLLVSTWTTQLFTYELTSSSSANIEHLSEKRAQKLHKIIRSIGSPDLINIVNETNPTRLTMQVKDVIIPKLVFSYLISKQIKEIIPTLKTEASAKLIYITLSEDGRLQIREICPKKEINQTIQMACNTSSDLKKVIAEMYNQFRNSVGHNDVIVTDKKALKAAWRAHVQFFPDEYNSTGT